MSKSLDDFEQSSQQQQEKTLHDFKDVLQNLVYLLRTAAGADTTCLYWVNRNRRQFVKEAQSTSVEHARFEDRVAFEDHLFNEYKNISTPTVVKSNSGQEKNMLLIPFRNNNETVALTAIEGKNVKSRDKTNVVEAYNAALGKMLNTYLEVTNLYETEQQWAGYEKQLEFLNQPGHYIALLDTMVQKLQSFLAKGSVTVMANESGSWKPVLSAQKAIKPVSLGLPVEERTIAGDAIENEAAEFAIHFNGNPKRISPREQAAEGATLAIPFVVNNQIVALILITDENPLVFKESVKHKLKNLVRLTALEMQIRLNKSAEGLILTNEYDAVIPDIWERTVDTEIQRLKEKRSEYITWAGFVTLSELSKIRTQLRVEELRHMQKDIIRTINPANHGVPGFVGFHADYQYFILLQSKNAAAFKRWKEAVDKRFSKPFVLSIGKQIESSVKTGFVKLESTFEESYDVVQRCKQVLNSSGGMKPVSGL